MAIAAKQPSIRFSKAGPFSKDGVSYLPKVVTFKKDEIAGTENNDFLTLPAGTFVADAFMRCDATISADGVVTLGLASDPDAIITSTDFGTGAAVGDWARNANGLYLDTEDTIRLAVSGTATEGAVSGFIVYYEVANMVVEGLHFAI